MTETSVTRPPGTAPTIPPGRALGAWAAGWVLGPFLAGSLMLALVAGSVDDASIADLLAATAAGWAMFLVVLGWVSRRDGTGDLRHDLAVRFRAVDLAWVPAGALAQLVLVPAVYVPLRQWWPDTFSRAELEERAQDLVDKAGGIDTVLLAVLVVIGAPIVEELVYRGLLQRSFSRVVGAPAALVVVSLAFALIHFSPVEIPGLFVAGLVFGAGVAFTGRLGPALLSHAAFNATGLILLLR